MTQSNLPPTTATATTSTMEIHISTIAVLNFTVMMCAIPIIWTGHWLSRKEDNQYNDEILFAVAFILSVGITFFSVACITFIDSLCKKPGDMVLFLVYTAFLIVILLVFVVLVFIVAGPSGTHSVPGAAYKDHRLPGFSRWLRNYINNPENWNNRRNVIVADLVCQNLDENFNKYNNSAQRFYASHISPIESGCCKPPTVCGYFYIDPILWVNPTNISADPDCSRWSSSDTYTLCYNCDACKAGVIVNLRNIWMKGSVVLTVVLVVLICIHVIACRVYKNATTDKDLYLNYNYKQGRV